MKYSKRIQNEGMESKIKGNYETVLLHLKLKTSSIGIHLSNHPRCECVKISHFERVKGWDFWDIYREAYIDDTFCSFWDCSEKRQEWIYFPKDLIEEFLSRFKYPNGRNKSLDLIRFKVDFKDIEIIKDSINIHRITVK